MKAKPSPLILIDFAILNSNFKFTAPANDIDIRELVSSYEIDIDFAFNKNDGDTRVFIKTAINQGDDEKPGYSIFAEGVAVFEFLEEANLTEVDKKSLLQYSSVSIALNSLRGFIATLTANAPFGRYIFPSIDVNDLLKQKVQKIQAKKKKK